jgi:hypothetical protein
VVSEDNVAVSAVPALGIVSSEAATEEAGEDVDGGCWFLALSLVVLGRAVAAVEAVLEGAEPEKDEYER